MVPFVGREADLELIDRCLREGGGTVVLAGARGVGKTRLAREIARRMGAAGDVVVLVGHRSARAIPFAALAPVLPRDAPDDPLLRLVWARSAIVERDPRLVIVDDAHWLDDASATVVQQLAADGAVPLLLVLARDESLPEGLAAIVNRGEVDECRIGPLSPDAVRTLVGSLLDGPVDGLVHSSIEQRARGFPLLVVELVRAGIDAGVLRRRDGLWVLDAELPPAELVVSLVADRIAGLGAEQRQALEIVALGQPLPWPVVERLGIARNAEELEAAGIVTSISASEHAVIEVSHPLYAEAALAVVSGSRRRRQLSRLADALEPVVHDVPDAVARFALWRMGAEQPVPSDVLSDASVQALVTADPRLGERLAAPAGAGDGGFWRHVTLGRALVALGRPDEASRALDRAADLAGTDRERLACGTARVRMFAYADGGPAAALRAARTIRDRLATANARDELDLTIAEVLVALGDLRQSLTIGARVADDAATADVTAARARALQTLAAALLGRTSAIDAAIDDGVRRCHGDEPGSRLHAQLLEVNRVMLRIAEGRFDDAVALGEEGRWRALRDRWHSVAGIWTVHAAYAAASAGRFDAASRHAETACRELELGDLFGMRPIAVVLGARARAEAGDGDGARSMLGVIPADANADVRVRMLTATARAAISRSEGDTLEAHQLACEHADAAADAGYVVLSAQLLYDVVRAGAADLVADRLTALSRDADSAFISLMADHAVASAGGRADDLEDVSGRWVDAGAPRFAAEALLQAAAVRSRFGDANTGQQLRARAAVLLGDASVSTSVAGYPLPRLTPRQQQIADLAADGLTSRQIADRLVISVRTVDTHLSAIYGLFGIRGRRDLATLLRPGARHEDRPPKA